MRRRQINAQRAQEAAAVRGGLTQDGKYFVAYSVDGTIRATPVPRREVLRVPRKAKA